MHFGYQTGSTKLQFSSWSFGTALRVPDWHCKVAIFELELWNCTSRTRLALQSCDFRAGALEMYFAYQTGSTKLRFSSSSFGNALRVPDWHYKVAIFELEL